MDSYTLTFFIAALVAAMIVGYLFGLRTTRMAHEVMQRKLVDAYDEHDWCQKKYLALRKKYQEKLDMINELEATNALLRKANEQIYEDGIKDGKQSGKIEVIKQLGKSLLDESAVLGGNGIVEKNTPINQLAKIKD